VDEDNLLEEPDVDMNDFFLHVDRDAEWFASDGVVTEEGVEGVEIEVVNNDVFISESSSNEDESKTKKRRRSTKAIKMAQENSEARVTDPFL